MDYPTEKLIYLRQKALMREARSSRLAAIAASGKRRAGLLRHVNGLYHTALVRVGYGLVKAGQRLQERGQLTQLDKVLTS